MYETADFDSFIKEHASKFGISEHSVKELKFLEGLLAKCYEACREVDDFTLIRRREWDKIIPLAQECSRDLSGILEKAKKMPG